MFIGGLILYKRLSIYVKTDGNKFYAYRFPKTFLCEVDLSKPVYYKFGKTGYNDKYIVFSNEYFEFRELSKNTMTFFARFNEKNIILVNNYTEVEKYLPIFDWIEVEDRTGLPQNKQANGNNGINNSELEHIVIKFPKFFTSAVITLLIISLIYLPVFVLVSTSMFIISALIALICLLLLLCLRLWKIELFEDKDYFIYSSIFTVKRKKVYFNECDKVIWAKRKGHFKIKLKSNNKIYVSTFACNFEMLRKAILQNGIVEE